MEEGNVYADEDGYVTGGGHNDKWQGLLLDDYGVEWRVEPVKREQLGTALKR